MALNHTTAVHAALRLLDHVLICAAVCCQHGRSVCMSQVVRSVSATPRRASQPSCSKGGSQSPGVASGQVQRQQEVALQRILEEEILKEMDREAALREVSSSEQQHHPTGAVAALLPMPRAS